MSSVAKTPSHTTSAHTGQTTTTPSPSIMSGLPMMLAFAFMFYFLLIRPQSKTKKDRQELVNTLKTKDEVVIGSGIIGRIEAMDDQFIKLKIATNTLIQVQKNAVIKLLPPNTYTD